MGPLQYEAIKIERARASYGDSCWRTLHQQAKEITKAIGRALWADPRNWREREGSFCSFHS